jgi:hypothetical protein
MAANDRTVLIENARIIFRNFAGQEQKFNKAGDRHFSVILPEDIALQMRADGWNVKFLEPREEGEDVTWYITVAVSYKVRPPRIVLLTSRGRQNLDEAGLDVLDWASIKTADMILNPFDWEVNGKTGIKAYLQSLFVTIEEDALELKYAVNETES